MAEPQVIVIGAGPVGLTLAIDLGLRGVRTQLIERRKAPLRLPKMERSNARTMEIFRRIGLSERIRSAGYPRDMPMDVFLVSSLLDPPLVHLKYQSVLEATAQIAARNDGSLPREPYQLVSQYTLEAILLEEAQRTPNVTVCLETELIDFVQTADGVRVEVRTIDGRSRIAHAEYLVGCDGASSTVRRKAGIALQGDRGIATVTNVFFRSDELWNEIRVGHGRHYCFVSQDAERAGVGGVMVVQDDLRHFAFHTTAPPNADMCSLLRQVTGLRFEPEILYVGEWEQHLLVAEKYSQGLVYLAGDSNHQYIPTGGLGMNTGIGDAIDLSWKLAGTLAGWGGPGLLTSFSTERRQVGLANREAVRAAMSGVLAWRAEYSAEIFENTDAGREARERFVKIATAGQSRVYEMSGAELGYRYQSDIIVAESLSAQPNDIFSYQPTTWPGTRLPHVWLDSGDALLDRLGAGFTLLRLGDVDVSPIQLALEDAGAPVEVINVSDQAVRQVYGCDCILVRPDLHVVWRGNQIPADTRGLVAIVTGQIPSTGE